jgi:hypothetical protein
MMRNDEGMSGDEAGAADSDVERRTGRDPVLDAIPIDSEGVWYVLGIFRGATGERRRGAARYLGLAACRYFREHLGDPELREELEKALAEAARDADAETAFAGSEGLKALRG